MQPPPPPPPEPLFVLRGHRAAVQCVSFLPSFQALAAGDGEGELKLWDLETRRPTASIRAHESHSGILQVACPATSQHHIISQGRDGVVKLWQLHSGSSLGGDPVQVLSAGSYNFCRFALLQPGQGSSSCSPGPAGGASEAAAEPLGGSSGGGGGDGAPADATVEGFTVADDARQSGSAGAGGGEEHPAAGARRGALGDGCKGLLSQQLGQQSSGAEPVVAGWPPLPEQLEGLELTEEDEEALVNRASPTGAAAAAAAAEQGPMLLALPAADAADVGVWQLGAGGGQASSAPSLVLKQQRSKDRPSRGVCMALALVQPQGSPLHVVAGYEDGSVALWDARQPGRCLSSAGLHGEAVMCLAVAPSCRAGFSGSADDALAAFDLDLAAGKVALARKLQLPKPGVADVAVRPDGRVAASGGWDGKLRVWHCRTRRPLALLRWHSQQVACVAFSGDSRLLAAGSRDAHISVWDVFPPGSGGDGGGGTRGSPGQ